MGNYSVLLHGGLDSLLLEWEDSKIGDLMGLYAKEEGACIYDDAGALVMYVEDGLWREA